MSDPDHSLRFGEAGSRRLVWLTVALFAFLFVGAVVWNLNELAAQRRAGAALSNAIAYSQRLDAAVAGLREAESAARGYVIGGRVRHLEAYRSASERMAASLTAIQQTARPEARAATDDLATAMDAKAAFMARIVALRSQGDAAAAARAVASAEGDALMDEVLRQMRQVGERQAAEIDARLLEQGRRAARTEATVAAMFLALALAAIAAALAAGRFLAVRTRLAHVVAEDARRQRAILDAAHEGVLTLDEDNRIVAINPAGAAIFGYSPGELIGRCADDLMPEDALPPEGRGALVRQAREGGARFRTPGLRRDGSVIPVECSMTAVSTEDGLHYVSFLRDISERQQVEQMKDEFVSTVSHELRTPLTSIAGSLGLVAGGAAGEIGPQAARLIGIAQSNCQRLVRLINDVLDVEKLEAGKLVFHMETLDLRQVAERAIAAVRGYAEPMAVTLALEPGAPVMVRGDADRLVQVATNLLSNAARYSPRDGIVRVEVGAEGRNALLSVRDTGPGVPEAFRERIFSRFVQAEASDARGKSGTGLGLYIARQIADRHDGRLWYEPAAGGGALFRLELPLASPADEEAHPGRRVLLVEDEPASAAVMEALLEEEGLEVDTAPTLAAARARLGQTRYGALVLDLRLPDGDGLELLRELRRGDAGPLMPILVVSGDPSRRDEPEVRAVERVDWLQKPIDLDRMAELIRAAVGRPQGDGPMILHVDDDRDIRELVAATLEPLGEVVSADGLVQARAILAERRPAVVVLDLELRDGAGADLIGEVDAPVVVFSAQDARIEIEGQVAQVLIKSRTPLDGLVDAVRDVLDRVRAEAAE